MKSYEKLLKLRGGGISVAFTLSEVLITLGIIGIVAALTLPALVTNIQNRGYVEGLKKNYSAIQQVTNKIIEEEGPPTAWSWTAGTSTDDSDNNYILNLYKKHLKVARACSSFIYNCPEIPELWSKAYNNQLVTYKALNGEINPAGVFDCIFCRSFPMQLEDGTFLGITFFSTQGGQVLWGRPKMYFTIDVNGAKGPNRVGRDVFFLYMNHNDKSGKILPYVNGVISGSGGGDFSQANTCDKDKSGVSCAYRVITEGKMNY